MSKFHKMIMGLIAALSLAVSVQVQAAPAVEPGQLLLAQIGAEKMEQQDSETLRAEQEKRLKEMDLEKSTQEKSLQKSKTRDLLEPPAASGTKRIGGQTIRGKETMEGD